MARVGGTVAVSAALGKGLCGPGGNPGVPAPGSARPAGSSPHGFPRYGYAGRYGYESDLVTLSGANPTLPPLAFEHLGWRWYQPDTGRFVQRDPIGIFGGLGVYCYASNDPLRRVDPDGLQDIGCDIRARIWEKCFLRGEEEKGQKIIKAQGKGAAIGAGLVAGWLAAGASSATVRHLAAVCAWGWSGFRLFGGSTGSDVLDDAGDAASWGGVGLRGAIGSLKKLLRRLIKKVCDL